MSKSVTIDNYDVKIHERYATDQAQLQPFFTQEASLIPAHSEVVISSSSVCSKWEELFETHLQIHPWALFSPPPSYYKMRGRLFSRALSERFAWVKEKEEEEEEEEETPAEEVNLLALCKEKIQSNQGEFRGRFIEKEQLILLNLLNSIEKLNGFLRELYSEKLRYQKG